MASIGDLLGGIGIGGSAGSGNLLYTILIIFIGVVGFSLALLFVWWFAFKRKQWNMKVEFRIPRDVRQKEDESIIGTLGKEWGKGSYNTKRGAVFVKRKGFKATALKPFDVKRYLSQHNILTVLQVGAGDYRPVLDESYIEVIDDKTGEEAALLRAKIDTSESKSWRNTFERESKSAYTIMGWLQEHGDKLAMGLVILLVLIGQAIVISRLR